MSQPYWVKVEIDFRLRLMWGWDELESKFRWNWVELGLSLVNVELIKKLCFHRIRVMVLNIFWSTHTAEQYLFLCFLQFLLLMLSNFFSNLRVVLAFLGPNVLFWVLRSGSEIVLGSTHTVQQLLFSLFPSILKFDFD